MMLSYKQEVVGGGLGFEVQVNAGGRVQSVALQTRN